MDRRQFLSSPALALSAASTADVRIDCQSHLFCPELLDLMAKRRDSPRVYRKGAAVARLVNEWIASIAKQHSTPSFNLCALPYLVGRIDHQAMVLNRGAERIRRAPSEYLRQSGSARRLFHL